MKTFGLCAILLGTPSWAGSSVATPPQVNGQRIIRHLESLSEYGKNPQGGVSRVAYTEFDRAGREYVMGLMREAGLAVSIDVAGNLVGTRAGTDATLKPLIIGSHIDSVPEGGNYDGDVGSLGAIEVAQTLNEHGVRLRHPLQVIIFENEEGALLGSTAIALGADAARLNSVSQSGKIVRDGVRFLGGDPDLIAQAKRQPGSIRGYIELHIEQGAVLEQQHVQIGIVEGIVGILDSEVTVEGFANHAGTTPMDQRHDAMLSAARFVEKFNLLVTSVPGRQVGTVGWIKAEPGAYNVIPGKVRLGLELRDLDASKIKALFDRSREAADEIGRLNGTAFHFSSQDISAPALTDKSLQGIIGAAAKRLNFSTKLMPSGAGHDAQEMANLGPIGMIFIPSVGGISHSPKEYSAPGDIENGANVLLGTLRSLDVARDLK
ncbi:MAG TPA: Zn-dependent hydrolase [Steroidobacteraceae bacterium]|nr:Zn-dependent hydrolase [Steroidobacteraceae bacterium]